MITQYLYGQAIDQLFARADATGALDWYLGDILGSARQIIDTDGAVLDEIDYDSFGQVLNESTPANGDRFKYTAREWDALFGQYYYRARYYGADVGRFTQEDPLSFAAGDSNVYRYVFNTPVSATDPTGMQTSFGNRIEFARTAREVRVWRENAEHGAIVSTIYLGGWGLIRFGPTAFRFIATRPATGASCGAGLDRLRLALDRLTGRDRQVIERAGELIRTRPLPEALQGLPAFQQRSPAR